MEKSDDEEKVEEESDDISKLIGEFDLRLEDFLQLLTEKRYQ
jgi:hypothetical protein